jgi:hypothetical protein
LKPFGLALVIAVTTVAVIGVALGDPRGTHSMARSEWIVLAALVACIATTLLLWRGARLSAWWLVPLAVVAGMGALSGWIAGVEIAGDTERAVHLRSAPGKVVFLVAMTSAGMALPPSGIAALIRRLGRART